MNTETPKVKATKITIGRLFNLGNYQHIRYEVAVDVPEGQSASAVLIGLENILAALNPKRPPGVPTDRDVAAMEPYLKDIEAQNEDEIVATHGKCKALVLADYRKRIDKDKERLQAWHIMQLRARQLLDDLGGAETFTDAKANWDDDGEY